MSNTSLLLLSAPKITDSVNESCGTARRIRDVCLCFARVSWGWREAGVLQGPREPGQLSRSLFCPFPMGKDRTRKGKSERESGKTFQKLCTPCLKQANECCILVESLWRADMMFSPCIEKAYSIICCHRVCDGFCIQQYSWAMNSNMLLSN